MTVNSFDYQVCAFLNHFCRKYELFDKSVVFLSDNHLFKGGILVIIIWFIWFSTNENNNVIRLKIVSALLGSFVSIFIARILPHILPFRARPILNPDNHFVDAYGLNRATFDNLSSFPSDHCTLFFALATGIFFASRRFGIAAYLYVLLFIAFPRVYLGLHYFTDILCGAVIGMIIVSITNMDYFRARISARILNYSITHAAVFYALFFFITFEIAEMFTSIRSMASFLLHPYTYFVQ